MTEILAPGNGVFFMRVGTHARETLDKIVARKLREIERVGYTFWGYGGNTCHPLMIVQPFAKEREQQGKPVFICMEEMESTNYFGEPQAAAEYSTDGRTWHEVPKDISVRGSRYALRINGLKSADFTLPLEDTRVRVGTSSGRLGSHFVAGTIDKACLVVEPGAGPTEPGSHRQISLVAEVHEPYAMLLRNFRAPAE
jgi:hypothetical protein